jgi:hypothetical protein
MAASRKRFTTFVLDNAWNVEFPTEPTGVLRLGPGKIQLQARLSERRRLQGEESGCSVIDSELRLTDAQGQRWQTTATFFSHWLLWPLFDLARKEPGRWLRNAPAEWRAALEQRQLLDDVDSTYFTNFVSSKWLDNTGFRVEFKYVEPDFVIAALTADRLVVQVNGLTWAWNPVPVAGPDGSPLPLPSMWPPAEVEPRQPRPPWYERQPLGGEPIPPLAYTIDAGRLLFRNTAREVPAESGRTWQDENVSGPLLFRRVRGKEQPQRTVTFHAGTRPAAIRVEDGSEFVVGRLPSFFALELQTDAGGRLVVPGLQFQDKPMPYAVRIDRHPGSDVHAQDVLRCRLRLADADGTLWESTTLCTGEVFLEKLIDLEKLVSPDTEYWPHFEPADDPWEPVPGSVLGIRLPLEDGTWRYFLLGDALIAFHANGQQALVDVIPDDKEFLIRIRGLVGRRRPFEVAVDDAILLDPEARRAESAAWERDQELPPIRYSLSLRDLAFRNTTFAVDEGFWHGNAIPIPVVFTRVGKSKKRTPIRFVPDES